MTSDSTTWALAAYCQRDAEREARRTATKAAAPEERTMTKQAIIPDNYVGLLEHAWWKAVQGDLGVAHDENLDRLVRAMWLDAAEFAVNPETGEPTPLTPEQIARRVTQALIVLWHGEPEEE